MQSAWPEYGQNPFAASDADLNFLIENQPAVDLFGDTAAASADLGSFETSRKPRQANDRLLTQHSSSQEESRLHASHVANPSALNRLTSQALAIPSESGFPTPVSAFHTHSQQGDPSSSVRITFCQPSGDKASPGEMHPSKLSTTPSDNVDTTCHMALRKRSSSLMTTSTGEPPDEDDAEDPLPIQRPLIQTGIDSGVRRTSSDTPKASGGRRVVRTSEERKQHRMAKNRATAAASRKRKQAMKEELLQKADLLQMENSQLCELLRGRDAEIRHLRERLAVAEMIPPRIDAATCCNADEQLLFSGSPTF